MKKNVSTLLSSLLLCSMLGSFQASAHEKANMSVLLEEKELSLSPPPIIRNNRLLVPLRSLAETVGATVNYEGSTKNVKVKKGSNIYLLPLEAKNATINGVSVALDTPATLVHNVTYVPIRFFSENFGLDVSYDQMSRTVSLKMNSSPHFKVLSPKQGDLLYGNQVKVSVAAFNHELTDFYTNTQPKEGQGHIHLWLDTDPMNPKLAYKLINGEPVTFENLKPGDHTLTVQLVGNNHKPIEPIVKKVIHFKTTDATLPVNHSDNIKHGGMNHYRKKEDTQPPRVYTINETSNTVSVIDPATNKFLMDIPLGDEDIHRPLYNGFIDVHGAWLSPNGKILIVTARGSSSVIKIDTGSNQVAGYNSVGREPHAPMFTRDGKEVWVTIRGENDISIVDPETMTIKENVETINGPGMVYFTANGKYAFVTSQKGNQLDIIDTATRKSVKKLTVGGEFSPFLTLSPDGREMWVINKDTGKVTVIDTQKLEVKMIFEVGGKPNHVHFISTVKGDFAYITSAANNQVEVYTMQKKKLVTKIDVGKTPHAVMPNADMSRMYVDNETSNDVYVIDTATNQVIAIIPVGKKPIDLIYKP